MDELGPFSRKMICKMDKIFVDWTQQGNDTEKKEQKKIKRDFLVKYESNKR